MQSPFGMPCAAPLPCELLIWLLSCSEHQAVPFQLTNRLQYTLPRPTLRDCSTIIGCWATGWSRRTNKDSVLWQYLLLRRELSWGGSSPLEVESPNTVLRWGKEAPTGLCCASFSKLGCLLLLNCRILSRCVVQTTFPLQIFRQRVISALLLFFWKAKEVLKSLPFAQSNRKCSLLENSPLHHQLPFLQPTRVFPTLEWVILYRLWKNLVSEWS